MSDHIRLEDIEKKLVVALKPHREDDPPIMLISVILLEPYADITDDDGLMLFNTNTKLSCRPWTPNRFSQPVSLWVESSEVKVKDPRKQVIYERSFVTARTERQFRLEKLGDYSMETKQIYLTVKQGARPNKYPIYLRCNKARQPEDRPSPPVVYNVNTPKIESSTIGNNGPVSYHKPTEAVSQR